MKFWREWREKESADGEGRLAWLECAIGTAERFKKKPGQISSIYDNVKIVRIFFHSDFVE